MLVVLDGFGWRDETADNAVRLANTPVFDRLWASCPHALLRTSGADVGLPAGQMGNSEVGHLNIGAGRVVLQDLPRVGEALASGEVERAPATRDLIARLRQSGGTCHLMGLLSPGGVHAHQDHAVALAQAAHAGRCADRTARIHRRARYAAALGAAGHRAHHGGAAAVGADRDRLRPLLRDGPRQALGARRQGVSGARRGGGAALCRCARGRGGRLRARRHRRVRGAGRGRRLSRNARRRRRALLQFPRRPRARNSRGAARSEIFRLSAPAHRATWPVPPA